MTKTMKIILLVVIFAVVGIAVAGMIKFNILGDDVYLTQEENLAASTINFEEYIFNTEDGTMGVLSYESEDKDFVTLYINDESYRLKKVESGTEIKYASEDNSVIFSGSDDKTTIEINGQLIQGVTEFILIDDLDESTRRRVEVLKSNKQGDPNANKYDFGSNNENCGEGTTLEDGDCIISELNNDTDSDCDDYGDEACERLDTDDDGDSVPTEDETSSELGDETDNNCDDPNGTACEKLDEDDDEGVITTEDKANAEVCNGIDDDCNGTVDDENSASN